MKSEPTEVSAPLPLTLNLLGNMELRVGDAAPADAGYAKLRALLVFLAMSGGKPQRRDYLSGQLWPEMTESVAKQNLRRALFNLKALLGGASPLLATTTNEVALTTHGLHLDVHEFSREHDYSDAAQMERLAMLYRGEFMAGFSLPECPDFEDWLQVQREGLHRRALLLLDRLAKLYEQTNERGKALPFALRYTELEHWDEAGQRRAMRLLALNGQDSAALAHYESFRKLLKSELGVLPEEETRALAEHIRKGELVSRPVTTISSATLRPLAERRQVTVLFCELPVAMYDDPEEAMAQLREPQQRCAELIRQFGGHIVQTHGGGLLAYFGYPQAREDAARRAVQAALAVSRETLNGIEVRACVHTGLIVTGGDDAMPDTAGKTTKLAMRLRHGAGHYKVVISNDTMRIVTGYFACTPLGAHAFADFAKEVELFAVEHESGARTRLDAAAQLTPLVGRENEVATLMSAWEDATRGTRRIVLVQGEAGIGKSRLLLTLKKELGDKPFLLPELRCFPEYSQSPFHPLIAMLEAIIGCEACDTPELKFDKLVQYLDAHFAGLAQIAAPLLAGLMSLPLREPFRLPELPAQKLKDQTVDLLLQLLQLLSLRQPVLMVLEDLHWIDPSSLEFLNRFIAQDARCAVLAVCTARPGFIPSWSAEHFSTLSLGHLDARAVSAMVASLRGDLNAEQVQRIAARTDGVPLFIEEMLKAGVGAAQGDIPTTLHDLLAARMDSLGEAKHLAQLAATLGREFNVGWLRKIFPGSDETLSRHLGALQAAGLVLQSKTATRQFKHALIQEAAYQSQSRQDRQAAHQRIALMLQRDHADILANQPELLAQHLSAGGEYQPAIEFWMIAGQRAMQHSANEEAIAHFNNALGILPLLPAVSARDQLEANLDLLLGMAQFVTRGYGSLDARHAFSRAQELGENLQDGSITFTAIWGKWLGASSCENYTHAAELADRLFELAQASNEPVQLQQAYLAVGDCHLWRGQQEQACEYFERGLSLYRPEHHAEMVKRVGENVAVSIGSQYIWALWLSGKPEQAAAMGERTLELAQQLNHPYSLGYIYTHQMILARWRGDVNAMRRQAELALALSQQHGFHIWMVSGLAFQGLARCYQGDSGGIAQIQQSVGIVHAVMSGVEAFFIAALAEAQGVAGLHVEALQTMEQALHSTKEKDNRFWESEMLRLKGEYLLRLSLDDAAQAEACFAQALEVSRKQHAKSLELRAAMSMARLWQQQGKNAEARRLLQNVYDWFTEGFDSADLLEAAGLLRQLD